MATVIGQISSLQGVVKAINTVTGEVRVLEIGDSVFADEALQTSNGGAVMVSMLNGETLTLGRDTYMLLNDDVFGQANNIDVATEATSAVEALQAAILAGNIDLDELEETAAGEESMPGSASEGGVTVERGSAQGEIGRASCRERV